MTRRVLTMSRAALAWVVLLFCCATIASAQQIANTGTLTTNGQSVCFLTGGVTLPNGGWGTTMVQITGTWTGTVQFQISVDAQTFQTVNATPTNGSSPVTSATANGEWVIPSAASRTVCATATAAMTGTANVFLRGHPAGGAGSGGGGGGAAGSVTINDPSVTTQKLAISASGHAAVDCSNCTGSGASNTDNTAFAQSTNTEAPAAGLFATAWTNPTAGRSTIFRADVNGGIYTNLDKVGTSAITLGSKTSANSLPVVVASDQGVLPVSAASLPLPTGAATAAKQPALGTAGTPATDVITVQGSVSGTPLPVSLASVPSHAVTNAGTFAVQETTLPVAQSSTTSGEKGALVLGAVTTANPTYTTAQSSPLSLDTTGALRVNITAGSAANAAASATGSAVPSSADYGGVNVAGTLRGQTGVNPTGVVFAAQTDIASIGGSVPASANPLPVRLTDGASFLTPGTDYTHDAALTVASTAGPMTVGRASAAVPTDVSADNDAVIAWFLRSGAQVVQPSYAGTLVSTGNGTSGAGVQRVTVASDSTGVLTTKDAPTTPVLENGLTTTVQTVTGSPGILTSYYCYNPNATVAYVQIFDISGTVTLGTSTPKWSIAIPSGAAANLAGLALNFANAIKVSATTTATGSSAPATALDCNFGIR